MLTHSKLPHLFAVALIAIGGGCTSAQATRPAPAGCDLPIDTSAQSSGATALWLDGSAVGDEPTAERDADIDWAVAAAMQHGDRFLVGTFGGTNAQLSPSTCVAGAPLVPRGNNARVREQHAPELVSAVRSAIEVLPTGRHSTDLLTALRGGVQFVGLGTANTADAGERRIVIVTDGVQTAGCSALPNPLDPTTPGLVESLVTRCIDQGELPDATGIDVTILGVGRAATDLDAPAVAFLTRLATGLCEASHARCAVTAIRPTNP